MFSGAGYCEPTQPLAATQLAATLATDDGDLGASDDTDATPYELRNGDSPAFHLRFGPTHDVSIGRDKLQCQVAFTDDSFLSRVHCKVFMIGREAFLHDTSSNGTYLNGKVVGKDGKRALRAGDVISVVNPRAQVAQPKYTWVYHPPESHDAAGGGSGSGGLSSLYDLGKVLGTGNFAAVRLGTQRRTGQRVAVKVIEKKRFALQGEFSFSSLQSEVEILRKMHHKNIISVVDVFDDPATFTMVLELVSGGDLFDYIVGRGAPPFTELEARVLFVQLLEALLYMHSKDVVHRDLKPENILVQVDPSYIIPNRVEGDNQRNAKNIPVDRVTLKITDFGLAKFCGEHEVMTTMCGTPSYLAPEVMTPGADGRKAAGYTWAVDVWSLGVILYILLSGTPPKAPQSGVVTFGKHFAAVSAPAKRLIQEMLTVDPRRRIDLGGIVAHPWLEGVVVEGASLAVRHERLELSSTLLYSIPTTLVTSSLTSAGMGHTGAGISSSSHDAAAAAGTSPHGDDDGNSTEKEDDDDSSATGSAPRTPSATIATPATAPTTTTSAPPRAAPPHAFLAEGASKKRPRDEESGVSAAAAPTTPGHPAAFDASRAGSMGPPPPPPPGPVEARWLWKLDLDRPDTDPAAWKAYSDTDSAHIEKMFRRGTKSCKVASSNGDYRVSFEGMFQYRTTDTSRQRPVQRVLP